MYLHQPPGNSDKQRVSGTIPEDYIIYKNYLNPFNPTTKIIYGIPESSQVRLSVFNPIGQYVVTLVEEKQDAGYHEITFDASALSSGIYLYQ